MASIANSRSMQYSRFFANNLEYASKVYTYKSERSSRRRFRRQKSHHDVTDLHYKPFRPRAQSAPSLTNPVMIDRDTQTHKTDNIDKTTQTRTVSQETFATKAKKDCVNFSVQTDYKILTSVMQQTDDDTQSDDIKQAYVEYREPKIENIKNEGKPPPTDDNPNIENEGKPPPTDDNPNIKNEGKPAPTDDNPKNLSTKNTIENIKNEGKPPPTDDNPNIKNEGKPPPTDDNPKNLSPKNAIDNYPRVVISIPSVSYTFKDDTFDRDWFKDAIRAVVKQIDNCGILFDENGSNIQAIVGKVDPESKPEGLPQGYQYQCATMANLQFLDNFTNTTNTHSMDEMHTSESVSKLLTWENNINKRGYCTLEEEGGDKKVEERRDIEKEKRKIRVSVVLLVMGGDLSALEHVARALHKDISVVVVTGTGGSADFLSSYMERNYSIRHSLPIMFMQRFEDDILLKVEEAMDRIRRREWLISFVEQGSDSDLFWEKLSDGILRAWAFEKKEVKENDFDKEIFTTPVPTIAQYVFNEQRYSVMTKRELFGGLVANKSSYQIQSMAAACIKNHNEESFRQILKIRSNRFLGDKIEIVYKEMLQNAKSEQKTCIDLLKVVHGDAASLTHGGNRVNIVETVTVVSEQLLKGMWVPMCGERFSCSCRNPRQTDNKTTEDKLNSTKEQETSKKEGGTLNGEVQRDNSEAVIPLYSAVYTTESQVKKRKNIETNNSKNEENTSDAQQVDDDPTRILRMAVLLNDSENFYLWDECDYPLQTALLASEYLRSMSKIAEECFEEELQEDLMTHSNVFKERAILLLQGLHAYNNKMAKQALDYVCRVWDVEESPIRFGHHYGIEEFISHSAAQKDARVRMFAFDELPKEPEDNIYSSDEQTKENETVFKYKMVKKHNFKSFVMHHWNSPGKLMSAPVMRIVFHLTSFLSALTLFSIFLTTDLNDTSISVMEILVSVFMVGEFVEEIISMIRPENGGGFSCLWVFMHMYNVWNILDFMFIFLYWLAFILHMAAPTSLIVHIRRLYSISLLFMFLRLLNFFLLFKKIGIIVIMVKEMLTDLLYYLVILLVLLFGAGVVYHANLYPSHDVAAFPSGIDGWRIWTLLQLPFWQVFGDPNLDVIEGTDSNDCTYNESIWKNNPDISRCPNSEWITPVIAAFYMILTNWLLLNIVIAMFSERFARVMDKAAQKWRFYYHSVVVDYEYRYPSPLNIPIQLYRLIILIIAICKCCKKTTKSNDNKKIKEMLQKQREIAKKIVKKEKREKTNVHRYEK